MTSTPRIHLSSLARRLALALALIAGTAGLNGCAAPKESVNAPDVLSARGQQAVLLFSTSTPEDAQRFIKGVAFKLQRDDGTESVTFAYDIGGTRRPDDIATDHTRVFWITLEPGRYQMMTMRAEGCVHRAFYLHFTLAPGAMAYLGDVHRVENRISLRDERARDVEFFRRHAVAGQDATFTPLAPRMQPLTLVGCDNPDKDASHVWDPSGR